MFESSLSFLMSNDNKLPYHVNDHIHPCYEMVYYCTGRGISTIGGTDFEYSPNTLVIIPPEVLHSEIALEETKLIYIGFNFNNSPNAFEPCLFHDTPEKHVYHLLVRMKEEMSSRDSFYNFCLTLLTQEIIIELLRLSSISTAEKENTEKFEYIYNFIDTNFNQDIDLQSLANLTGYSYDRFRHLFKELTGTSPKQYIINKKLDNACALLRNSSNKISAISKECGFSTVSQFITCFRSVYHITPKQYAKQANNYDQKVDYMGKQVMI